MATMFGFFWTLDTTPMMNIEDRPLMIVAGMETNRKSSPYGGAFLPSEGEWVFDFSMVVVLPLLYGINVIRNIQQVVMKESIGKMIKFTTESGMVASADSNNVSKNTSTIKHRVPLVMGVPLRIVSLHQGTQKKKRYSSLKNKAEIAKRRKEQRKPL
jgi:hypothetical protein